MIQIRRFEETDSESVRKITLLDGQAQFAETAEEFLNDHTLSTHKHVIQYNDEIVGFFKLDTVYPLSNDFCPKRAIGLRKFVIDSTMQGKGIGSKAVSELLDYLNHHYTDYSDIVLTVNCKNQNARACYLKTGFIDSGELYLAGPSGPQHIMSTRIKAANT
ncbi:GNAT family N-acetyltransferase [Vibrio sp. 10N.261.55.A7]|uniref:GNAT family N-acetyltransferase n=1 Tax=Vibrio sp. 10N.261.55.A7 TaxID=1880851 RepID=UPI000C856137|nr:GNAT family N-acetyltransferase [Vibrio sp. 10N.261.55.A7]PMJ88716.1 GNAT family N-acetyltransferase [Vibrio sp. 10N.261.55.A7]